jgi:carbon-monoxide dehydrogenase large subunit
MEQGIGQPVRRQEDLRFLSGKGYYSDDCALPGQAYAYMLRSPHAHARVAKLDIGAAAAAPGVLAVLTAAEYRADGLNQMPRNANPIDGLDPTKPALHNRDGSPIFSSLDLPLAEGRVRHIGECVAAVIAETLAQAQDAAELIEVDYEPLPAVSDVRDAVASEAPDVWDELPGNVAADCEWGDKGTVDAAFASADHVVTMDLRNNRVANAQMEPRAAVGEYDEAADRYTLHAGSQNVHRQKMELARILGVKPGQVRVVAGDVGGGYGPRMSMYPEFVLVVWAAKRLGRPVKWTSTRSEAFQSDHQARDQAATSSLAFDAEGRILAMRCEILYNAGAMTAAFVSMANGTRLVTSLYDIQKLHLRAKAVLTNTVPTAPYRGAGRPEAMYNIERILDQAAEDLGIDRVEIRRRNLIPPDAIPYTSAMGIPYDSGEFETYLDKALALHDWDGFAARRAETEAQGRLRGIGLGLYIQIPVGARDEWGSITIKPEGRVEFLSGSLAQGQGHETSFRQVIHEWLGVPIESIDMTTGDTDIIPIGGGTHSDRSMRLSGAVMVWSSEQIIDKGKEIAAHLLEAAIEDITFSAGTFTVAGTDRRMGIFDVARAAEGGDVPEALAGPLNGKYHLDRRLPAYPAGCAVCEVEIDPETGVVDVVRHSAIDDVGRVINPMIVHGQTHGGIVGGLGQALMEDVVYARDTGQLLAGSFMDYAMPRADDWPFFRVDTHEVIAPSNPLGVKGGGEGGTIPALAALTNAVVDALGGHGVRHIEMPITAERVWRAMRDNV